MDTPIPQPTISVVIICKNEFDHIERCLESVKDADEIIVCDTGSTDGGATVSLARKYTPNVFEDYTWNDSFAEARNHAKSKATKDWIFSIDCDEYCHDFGEVRKAVAEAETQDIKAIDITQIAEDTGQINMFPRIFKNIPEIQWKGAAHNYLTVLPQTVGNVKITYGYSLAHVGDPDRTLRILEKTLANHTAGPRELYYLAREYFYRKNFTQCTAILGKYVVLSQFKPEKADAFLMMARAYWEQHMGDDARDACLQAIAINANFKEAILFMAEICGGGRGNQDWDENARQWRVMALTATNNNVLFIRT